MHTYANHANPSSAVRRVLSIDCDRLSVLITLIARSVDTRPICGMTQKPAFYRIGDILYHLTLRFDI